MLDAMAGHVISKGCMIGITNGLDTVRSNDREQGYDAFGCQSRF